MAFLYSLFLYERPFIAEITCSVLIFTAVTHNYGDSPKSRHTTKIIVKFTAIVNTWLAYSVNKC